MMLQGEGIADSGDADASASASAAAAAELAAAGFSEEERARIEEGGRNSGGNRWPRQETLALLKIRSDMDVAFRDSSLKGPLWDEVSRKLAELGYHRSAKKCKEKFENVYKYHKRTKEGRTSKADGKTYRFFDQLQALEANPGGGSHQQPPPPPPLSLPPSKPPAMLNTSQIPSTTVPSVVTPINITHQNNVDPISVAAPAGAMNINHHVVGGFPFSHPNMLSASTNSTSSSTSSDDEPPERRRNRKRKWKDFFGRLMKEVIDKQEELQSKFLDTLERRERDRMAREEAWRIQEMAKMKREHDLLVQERSMVAAKDAAVITFLQKITEQNPNAAILQIPAMQLLQQQPPLPPPPPPPSQQMPPMQQQPQPQQQQQQQRQQQVGPSQHQVQTMPIAVPVQVPVPVPVSVSVSEPAPQTSTVKNLDNGGGGENLLQPSPSRWPKAEINALIKLRTTLDTKYQESGPKGPLWEEISSAMRKLGYNRNAKRCKEKWENINKYYKKVKESSKKRPEDSKTCPYFHQLDAIYREKASIKLPETQMAPIMARPEQQWPLPATAVVVQEQQHLHQQPPQQQSRTNESRDQNAEEDYDDEEDDDEEEEEEEGGGGGEYEIFPNKTSSMAAVE
ncbi:trihelix transcription factor GT-2-like [Cynara cardunculus var. scolymus]|uniref:trihelix transcription factor GT-2-like n=1 Tax=Cynara cardunculus var. scolymus TaxID=59895 RepID=UPI000D62650A|nr:trihelix transcription factor GT-2-like [Cynara cardunculus var. scolymus]